MYCIKCYSSLAGASERRCPKCGRAFDPANPETFLARPFPRTMTILLQIVATTVVAIMVAAVVAFHQMARSSGH